MIFDMGDLPPGDRYKLLTGSVTPRPIAWLTTRSKTGVPNAAPYSFFNVMSADPPLVVIGIMRRPDGHPKDSAANILETREFVVNVVTEDVSSAMNMTSIDAPPDHDELAEAGIALLPSVAVAPPRIASSPVNMECRLYDAIELPNAGAILVGEVVVLHIADHCVDAETMRIDPAKLQLIGRLNGPSLYCRTSDTFDLVRPVFARP